jgi:hypothetical protein
MKKIKLVLLSLILTVGLSGCTTMGVTKEAAANYAVSAGTIAVGLTKLDSGIMAARESIINNQNAFTTEEWASLITVDAKVETLRNRIKGMIGSEGLDYKAIIVNLGEFTDMVEDVREMYFIVDRIVTAHYAEFTPEQKNQVLASKAALIKLNVAFEDIKSQDGVDATGTFAKILGSVGTITTLIKVLLPLIVV